MTRVVHARFTARATSDELRDGLLGHVTLLTADGLALDGIALRRSRAGRLHLAFPARVDRLGRRHPYVRPISADVRASLERQVLDLLGLAEELNQKHVDQRAGGEEGQR